MSQLTKAKQSLSKKLEETKSALDSESTARSRLATELRSVQDELSKTKDQLEDEEHNRDDLQRLLNKVQDIICFSVCIYPFLTIFPSVCQVFLGIMRNCAAYSLHYIDGSLAYGKGVLCTSGVKSRLFCTVSGRHTA